MVPTEERDDSPVHPDRSEIISLVRAVRWLTVAVWCLAGLLIITYLAPWASFFWQVGKAGRHSAGTSTNPEPEKPSMVPFGSDFDNQFHERSPEEKVKRATVIVLAQYRLSEGKHKVIISEIMKMVPGVSFYYKVGDEFPMLSHVPSAECEGCEGDGEVVFLIGNPAQMASAYSYRRERIDGMGGLSLTQLRALAHAAPPPVK
jgi:hypothetical protein